MANNGNNDNGPAVDDLGVGVHPPAAPVHPAPAQVAAPVRLTASSVGFTIAIPNLRNGALVNIQQAAPKASMSALYSWPIISRLASDQAVDAVVFSIRASYAQALHALGPTATAALQVEYRKKAIVLGSIRAGAAAAYRLAAADMTMSELCPSGMEVIGGAVAQSASGSTSTARWTSAQSMEDITPAEEGVISLCVYLGMAVPVLQGVSLVMTGHHYIPTTYSLFKGLKKQGLGSATTETRAWVDGMGETFDDMAFHKACHPVAPLIKRALARDMDVAQRLRASGHGSAAIRLPAVPSEASGGKAVIALVKSASETFAQMGHSVSWENGASLMVQLEHADPGAEEAAACDRIIQWIADNSAAIAFCAGIVTHVHESTGSGRNTILAAYSIKRLIADNPAAVNRGVMYARSANARLRLSMESGTYVNPDFKL